jgi:hypothetical protein
MKSTFFFFFFFFLMVGCDSSDPDPVTLDAEMASDIVADPATLPPDGGPPVSSGRFSLFSLSENRVVLPSSETDPTVRNRDSASTAWDLGFSGTTIIINSGMSGPGSVEAQLLTETFADVTVAPTDRYVADGKNTCPAVQTPVGEVPGTPYAICSGSDNGWYNYNPQTNLISPIPGRTIVLKTVDGHYAKLRILSYYQGNPNPPDPSAPSRYYTFEYVLQPDGSRNFETTTAD